MNESVSRNFFVVKRSGHSSPQKNRLNFAQGRNVDVLLSRLLARQALPERRCREAATNEKQRQTRKVVQASLNGQAKLRYSRLTSKRPHSPSDLGFAMDIRRQEAQDLTRMKAEHQRLKARKEAKRFLRGNTPAIGRNRGGSEATPEKKRLDASQSLRASSPRKVRSLATGAVTMKPTMEHNYLKPLAQRTMKKLDIQTELNLLVEAEREEEDMISMDHSKQLKVKLFSPGKDNLLQTTTVQGNAAAAASTTNNDAFDDWFELKYELPLDGLDPKTMIETKQLDPLNHQRKKLIKKIFADLGVERDPKFNEITQDKVAKKLHDKMGHKLRLQTSTSDSKLLWRTSRENSVPAFIVPTPVSLSKSHSRVEIASRPQNRVQHIRKAAESTSHLHFNDHLVLRERNRRPSFNKDRASVDVFSASMTTELDVRAAPRTKHQYLRTHNGKSRGGSALAETTKLATEAVDAAAVVADIATAKQQQPKPVYKAVADAVDAAKKKPALAPATKQSKPRLVTTNDSGDDVSAAEALARRPAVPGLPVIDPQLSPIKDKDGLSPWDNPKSPDGVQVVTKGGKDMFSL